MVDKHLPSTVATLQDAWWMEDERQRQRSQSKSSQSAMSRRADRIKPRTEPPPQGPGGRCRGTYELCPSSSDA